MSSVPEAIAAAARTLKRERLSDLFARDPARVAGLTLTWDDWYVDLAKERLTPGALALLVAHAEACNLAHWIDALFAGEKLNLSEGRPALHTALRQQDDAPVHVDGVNVIPAIRATQARMRALSADLREGRRLGATGRPIRAVVNLGIGGSDLGPRLVCDALPPASARMPVDVAFVANVDPAQLTRALAPLDPATTLFVVTSKTFTTQETLANAASARAWLVGGLGPARSVDMHFVGVTANVPEALAFGVRAEDTLPLWDWVGGRYSLWSAVGLAITIRHDWEPGQPVVLPATIDEGERDAALRKLDGGISERRTLEAWEGDGVTADVLPSQRPVNPVGLLLLEEAPVAGAERPSYFIACANFFVITRYNRSRLYAAAVWSLAEAVRTAREAGR